MVTIGIDPGVSGAVALIQDGQCLALIDMPVMPSGRGKRQQVNPVELGRMLDQWKDMYGFGERIHLWVELVHSMPKNTPQTAWSMGDSHGAIRAVVALSGLPAEYVAPGKWKRAMNLIKTDKEASRAKAMQLFPDASLHRKKDHNRAEALLIATYGERQRQ